jgi:LPXTG-motif cell wall-anchored protein
MRRGPRGVMAGALAIAGLLVSAGPALAQASLSVSPSSVAPGAAVTVSGNVGNGCTHGDQVTLISAAFNPAHEFAGVPAVNTTSNSAGVFSASAAIPTNRSPGTYSVSARCGGGRFGDAQVTVAASGGGTLPRTGFTPWLLVALGLAMALAGFALRRSLDLAGPR